MIKLNTKPNNCPYLQEPVGRARCNSCRNTVDLKVFNCKEYGRCTISIQINGISCCRTCPLNPSKEIPEEEIE